MATHLRGMTWDHIRGRRPLEHASELWQQQTGVSVRWDARPLKAFEDQPLEDLVDRYDLVMMDHPFAGRAAEADMAVAVEEWADAAYLDDQRRHSVGPSFDSYTYRDRQWALAADAACQVAAYRPDLLPGDLRPAGTWDEVEAVAAATAGTDSRVAIPLNPNHAYCAFLSIGITEAGADFWLEGKRVDPDAAAAALRRLRGLTQQLHPASANSDPIAIFELMSTTDEVWYCPLLFGYSNYARESFRPHRLAFHDAPSGPSGTIGSVLGGVGIAVSSRSPHVEEAADFARFVAGPDFQRDGYVRSEGQPGHLAAWRDPVADALVGGFFSATRETIEDSFTRPKVPGHRRFQELAGELLHRGIWSDAVAVEQTLQDFDELTMELLDAS